MRRLLIFGDSISSGTHGDKAYLPYIEKHLAVQLTNRSVGSSGVARTTPGNLLDLLEKTNDENFDAVLVWHGSNDWYWGTPLGMFMESMVVAVKTIRKRNPEAMLLWVGPLYRFEIPDAAGESIQEALCCRNKVGLMLDAYAEAIEKTMHELHVAYLNIEDQVQITEFNAKQFLEDGVHPNAAGYKRISRCLADELGRLLFNKTGDR